MIVVPYIILCNVLLLGNHMKFLDKRNRNINPDSSITIIC